MRFRLVEKQQHYTEGALRIVILSDEDVIGLTRTSDDGKIILKVPDILSEGKIINEAEAVDAIIKADVVLLYGENVIRLATDLGFVAKDSVLDIRGLKHVQIFKFSY